MRIECNYFDKSCAQVAGLGDLNITRSDFAHALLSLHVKFGSQKEKVYRYYSYILQFSADFRNQDGCLAMNPLPIDCYDGIKKVSDIYGAAITVLIARRKYGYSRVMPLSEGHVNASYGKRPDFIAFKGSSYALFKSKASIDHVSTEARDKGILQLNSVSSIKVGSSLISSFCEKVLVATHFRSKNKTAEYQNVKCNIYDPDNESSNNIEFLQNKCISDYYAFVQRLMADGNKIGTVDHFGHRYVLKRLQLGCICITIGMLDILYETNWVLNRNACEVLKTIMNDGTPNVDGDNYYSDGIYLKISELDRFEED